MGVTTEQFGKTVLGKDIKLYTIENKNGAKAAVTNIGACLVNLVMPDEKGNYDDIVLGFGSGEGYLVNGSFFGATVGRSANRIANAQFEIDGTVYKLDVNDNANNLHSDFDQGFHKQMWDAEIAENAVKFSYREEDGKNGFPGNLEISVTYTLTDDNAIEIHYEGISDKKTLINATNHTYFNLGGHKSGRILDTELKLMCSAYTPVVAGAIPTGEIAPVKGTVMDFTEFKKIGKEIGEDIEQLKLVKGYDHNFVVDNYDGNQRLIAVAKAAGRTMEVYSDLPGVQFYAGNCIAFQEGKDGAAYTPRSGFCLETQYFPNSINQEGFLSPVFDAGQKYDTTTVYKFV